MRIRPALALFFLMAGLATPLHASPKINTIAGGGPTHGIATQVSLPQPVAVARDATGSFYIASTFLLRVYKVDVQGNLTSFAGTGFRGTSGDGGPATEAQLNGPTSLAVDRQGNVFIGDRDRVRRVDARS